jgi:hypothetical protein
MSEDMTPTSPTPPMPPKDTSETISRSSNADSSLFGISVRAWIAYTLAATVCYMGIMKIEVVEPLYSALLLTLGFYFGQKK